MAHLAPLSGDELLHYRFTRRKKDKRLPLLFGQPRLPFLII
jgi:hypothetical protein